MSFDQPPSFDIPPPAPEETIPEPSVPAETTPTPQQPTKPVVQVNKFLNVPGCFIWILGGWADFARNTRYPQAKKVEEEKVIVDWH